MTQKVITFFCYFLKNQCYLIGTVVSLLSKALYDLSPELKKNLIFKNQYKVYQRLIEIKCLISVSIYDKNKN